VTDVKKPTTFGRGQVKATATQATETPQEKKTTPKATKTAPAPKKPRVAPVAPSKKASPQPVFSEALPKVAAKTVVDELLQHHRAEIDENTPNEHPESTVSIALAVELAKAELASREIARRSLLAFTKRTVPGYDAGWVHEDICRRLEKFARDCKNKLSPRLILAMPPRLGKSQLASINFPSWVLGNWPDSQFICCSYAQALSENFSKKIKWLMDTPDYETVFPGLLRDKNNDSLAEWSVTFKGKRTGGAYIAAGRGTGISGKGAEFLVIDDPIADAEEAESSTVKEGMWDWFTSTAYTRLAPGGGVLVIQTLWADDDLAGRLQQLMKDDPESDQYEVVLYPAIAEDYEYQHKDSHELLRLPHPIDAAPDCIPAYHKFSDYIMRRAPGDALHPARYDAAKYNKIKRTLPVRWWSALYQQNPVPDDGAYYKKEWFKFSPLPPLPDRRHWTVNIAWDFAISEKAHNDYTVGSVILHDDLDIMHVVDMVRFRSGDADTIVDAMVTLMKKWHNAGTLMRVGVEDGQIWRALKGTLIKKLKKERLFHFIGCIEELRPLTDKLARGRALQGRMQTGMVEFISPTGSEHDTPPWFDPARHEMVRFPAGRNDDICDSLAWNAVMLIDKTAPMKPQRKDHKSWKDKLAGLTNGARAKGYMCS